MSKSSYNQTVFASVAFLVVFFWLLGAVVSWGYKEILASNDGLFGYIDQTGAPVIDRGCNRPLIPETAKEPFSEGLAVVPIASTDSRMGPFFSYIDKSGRIVAPTNQFLSARSFSEGLAAVRLDSDPSWSFIDKTGKVVIKPNFISVQDFSEGLAGAQNRTTRRWQFIDRAGNLAFNQTFDAVAPFSQGRASVRIGEKWGLIDKAGKQVLEPTYQNYIHSYCDGVAAVEVPDSGKVVYLGLDGKVKLSLKRTYRKSTLTQGFGPDTDRRKMVDVEANCEDPNREFPLPNVDASEGLVVFEDNGKYGYKDLSGNIVIEPKYDYCWLFSEGRAIVLNRSAVHGLGYIDRHGKMVIPCYFSRAFPFSEGLAAVTYTQSGGSLYIDESGQDVFHKKPFRGWLFVTSLVDVHSFSNWFHSASGLKVLEPKQPGAESKAGALMEAQSFHEGRARVGQHLIWM